MSLKSGGAMRVYGLSHELPPGLRLSSTPLHTSAKKAETHGRTKWDLQSLNEHTSNGNWLAEVACSDGSVEEVQVHGTMGPRVGRVGGGFDYVRMGNRLTGRQRKWWSELSNTEREITVIQAAKANRVVGELGEVPPGDFAWLLPAEPPPPLAPRHEVRPPSPSRKKPSPATPSTETSVPSAAEEVAPEPPPTATVNGDLAAAAPNVEVVAPSATTTFDADLAASPDVAEMANVVEVADAPDLANVAAAVAELKVADVVEAEAATADDKQELGADFVEASDDREFEIVVYGATGFTGCLIVEHLDAILAEPGGRHHPWALAGRDPNKLSRMAARCKSMPGVLQVSDRAGVEDMARLSRVVLAAAGPFRLCGGEVVAACVEHGTHYVDVTGEAAWVSEMAALHHERARAKGVMIVHCAGQICVPDDVNCYLLARHLGPLRQFREYWNSVDTVTGGTFSTNVAVMEAMASPAYLAAEADPFSLGGRRSCGVRAADGDCDEAETDDVCPGVWLQPTYNGRTGSRIIRRSCALFEEMPADGVVYGESLSVTIREPAPGRKAAQVAAEQSRLPSTADSARLVAQVLRSRQERGEVPAPGQGPPPELRSQHYSEIYAVAEGENGEWAHVIYRGPQSYEVTAMASAASALVLVEEPELVGARLRGGVLTPAFAFHGSTWIQRLEARAFSNGSGRRMHFEVLPGKPPEGVVKEAQRVRSRRSVEVQMQLRQGEFLPWAPPALTA